MENNEQRGCATQRECVLDTYAAQVIGWTEKLETELRELGRYSESRLVALYAEQVFGILSIATVAIEAERGGHPTRLMVNLPEGENDTTYSDSPEGP